MASNNIVVKVPCSCGRSIEVTTTQAGTKIPCSCGSEVRVPNLSELRKLAGKHAYATNPAEKIKHSLADGINPSGESCLCCKAPNPIRFICVAECETPIVTGVDNSAPSIPSLLAKSLAMLFMPRLLSLFLMRQDPVYGESEPAGHDVSVELPLMVCERCVRSGQDPRRQSTAKKLMRNVPLYQELLDFYPELRLMTR